MKIIELTDNQITRINNLPAPNVIGFNSLYFHELTRGNNTETYQNWGLALTSYCKEKNVDFFYFFNDKKLKIHVYPNEIIEEWFNNKNV